MKIQLLYFVGCPHVDETRRALLSALAACAVTVRPWRSWMSKRRRLLPSYVAGALPPSSSTAWTWLVRKFRLVWPAVSTQGESPAVSHLGS
jgi:hypothetical protein